MKTGINIVILINTVAIFICGIENGIEYCIVSYRINSSIVTTQHPSRATALTGSSHKGCFGGMFRRKANHLANMWHSVLLSKILYICLHAEMMSNTRQKLERCWKRLLCFSCISRSFFFTHWPWSKPASESIVDRVVRSDRLWKRLRALVTGTHIDGMTWRSRDAGTRSRTDALRRRPCGLGENKMLC